MIVFVIVVCLASSPDVCREEQPPTAVISAMQCAIQGQQMAQDWLADHPKYELRGWRCKRPDGKA